MSNTYLITYLLFFQSNHGCNPRNRKRYHQYIMMLRTILYHRCRLQYSLCTFFLCIQMERHIFVGKMGRPCSILKIYDLANYFNKQLFTLFLYSIWKYIQKLCINCIPFCVGLIEDDDTRASSVMAGISLMVTPMKIFFMLWNIFYWDGL